MPMADGIIGSGVEEKLFRARVELAGMSIVSCRGVIHISQHGVVHTYVSHEDLHLELRGRGFKEMRAIDLAFKTSDVSYIKLLFSRDLLRPIGCPVAYLLEALANRAVKASTVPLELRT